MKKILLFCIIFLIGCTGVEQPVGVETESEVVTVIGDVAGEAGEAVKGYDYVNRRFSFALNIPDGFQSKVLPDDSGILLEKFSAWTLPPQTKKDESPTQYKVELVVLPFENFTNAGTLSEFVTSEYDGYSLEFADYDNFSGVYVDEGVGQDAKRHFFSLDDGGDFVYEVYIKLPSVYYAEYKQFFADFVAGIKIF